MSAFAKQLSGLLVLFGLVAAGVFGSLVWHPDATAGGIKKEVGFKKMGRAQPADMTVVPWPYQGKRRQASDEQIAQWVKDLGDSTYKVRESAFKALLEVGQPALKGLAEASRTGDLEMRRRAGQLRERIDVAEALAPTLIDLNVKDMPLPGVVAAMARQSRLKLELVPQQGPARQQLEQRKISLELNAVPFWEALDRLCRESGLVPATATQTTLQLQLAEGGKPYQPPTGYTGPFRMRITGMNYNRSVNMAGAGQPFGIAAGGGVQRTEALSVTMDLLGEPHLNILNMSNPTISEAIDETDQALALDGTGTTAFYPQPYYGAGMPAMQPRQTQFNLRPSTKPAARLKVLKGSVPVEIIAQRKPLIKVDDILGGKARVIKGEGDLMLAILQVQDNGGGRNGNIRFFLSGVDVPNVNPAMGFNPNMNQIQQRFELTDAAGHRINANINVNFNNFNFNNQGNDRSAEGNIFFNCGPNEGPPARLTYNNNQTIRTSVPFEFRDVPMP